MKSSMDVSTQTDPAPCQCQQRIHTAESAALDHSYSSSSLEKKPGPVTKVAEASKTKVYLSLSAILPRPAKKQTQNDDTSSERSSSHLEEDNDSSYRPSLTGSSDSDMREEPIDVAPDPITDDKFIVHKSQLLHLFLTCNEPGCGKPLSEQPRISFQGICDHCKSDMHR